MNTSSRGGVVAAVAIVFALIGWAVMWGPEPDPEGSAEAPAVDAAAESAPAEAAPAVTAAAPATTEVAAPTPPTIDVLRVAPDGTATLAGRAGAGTEISILVDGAEAASAVADSTGQFATVFTLAPSAAARMLSLAARAADGAVISGDEEVAIAPMPEAAPALIAEAAPETEAEPEAPAAIKITDAGAEVLQAPAGSAQAGLPAGEVTLDVISYTADGAVQLGGTGAAGAALRIYLDNAEIASAAVAADGGWSLTTSGIAPGIYSLRIDQLDTEGAVTSRIETPFKRETLEALATASAAPAPEAAPEATAEVVPDAAAEVSAQPEAPEAEAPAAEEGSAVVVAADQTAPAADAAPEAAAAPITVTVQPGFTLWAIARDNLGEGVLYVQVFDANRDQIKDPDLIYPGQVLTVPTSP